MCAPSNVAVDQLTEKIHKTGTFALIILFSIFSGLAILSSLYVKPLSILFSHTHV